MGKKSFFRHSAKVALALTVWGAAIGCAAADDGEITFKGSVSATTCVVTGGGGSVSDVSGGDFTVTLPTISTSSLATRGQKSGDTPFTISLSGSSCTNGKVANVKWETGQSTAIDSTTGNLKNTSTVAPAKFVQIGLLDENQAAINLSSGAKGITHTIAGNAAVFKYWAQYVATDPVTAGDVKSNVFYSIEYN